MPSEKARKRQRGRAQRGKRMPKHAGTAPAHALVLTHSACDRSDARVARNPSMRPALISLLYYPSSHSIACCVSRDN
mgnify:CR=1 FL=1